MLIFLRLKNVEKAILYIKAHVNRIIINYDANYYETQEMHATQPLETHLYIYLFCTVIYAKAFLPTSYLLLILC